MTSEEWAKVDAALAAHKAHADASKAYAEAAIKCANEMKSQRDYYKTNYRRECRLGLWKAVAIMLLSIVNFLQLFMH